LIQYQKKVREQYEENPYPRWRYTRKYLPFNFCYRLNNQIKPNQINQNNKFNNPNILIAGCGTGSHPISTTRYKNANILGVDLSLASLAYAKRKTEELNHNNVDYLHADILQLKKLNRKFDVIESSGVLHHMKDPIAGLKVLLDILEPHGFLRLGLYSEIARQSVVRAREFIKKMNLDNTGEDIKKFRQLIIDEKKDQMLHMLTNSDDFYSTSAIRDLLFHIQEHRFTIPEISKILKDLNLEFLGFDTPKPSIKTEYLKVFPDDKKNISLDNWHQFETDNPDTFVAMYQFWVKKI
jgi:SAM-dependent methyltransferase